MLLLSQGVPMITAGDEMSRSQQGNNNAWCQDNEISGIDWDLKPPARELCDFTRRLIALRREHPVLRRRQFLQGRPLHGSGVKDLAWFRPDGKEMTDEDWGTFVRCLGMRLAGDAMDEVDQHGHPVTDDTFLVLLNAHHDPMDFVLPDGARAKWELLTDTRSALGPAVSAAKGGSVFNLEARSLALFRLAKRRTVARKRTA
jgi:isoamylase